MKIKLGLSPGASLNLGLSQWYGVSGSGGSGPTPSTLLTGLASYWKLDETGGTRLDSVGTRHLALQGSSPASITYYQGKLGNAVSITGTSGNYLVYTNSSDLQSINWDNGFSVAGWIYIPAPASGRAGIFEKGSDWNLYVDINTSRPKFEVYDVSGTVSQAAETYILNTDTWYFLQGRYNSSTKKAEFRLNTGTWQTGAALTRPLLNASTFLAIGNYRGTYGKQVDDEVGLWTLYLTDAQFDELYNQGLGNTYPFSSPPTPPYITYLSVDRFTQTQTPFIAPFGGTRMMWPGFGSWYVWDRSGTFYDISGQLYKASGTASYLVSNPLITGSQIGRVLTITFAPISYSAGILLGEALRYDATNSGTFYNKRLRVGTIGTGFYAFNAGNASSSFDPAISTYASSNASGSARFYSPTPLYFIQAGQRFIYAAGNYLLYSTSRNPATLGYPQIEASTAGIQTFYTNFVEAILPYPFDTEWGLAQTHLASASSGTMMTIERNGQVEATWTPVTGSPTFNLMFRYKDASNWWAIQNNYLLGTTNLVRNFNGSQTVVATGTNTFVTGTSYVISSDFFNNVIHYTVAGNDKNVTTSGSFNMTETLATVDRPVTDFTFWSPTLPQNALNVLNQITGSWTPTFMDNFSGTSTTLTAHTPDIGTGTWTNWSPGGNFANISGGYVYRVSGSTTTMYAIDTGVSDFILSGKMKFVNSGRMGFIVRGTNNANSYILCSAQKDTTNLRISISGATTDIYNNGSFFINYNQEMDYKIICAGNTITYTVNGVVAQVDTPYSRNGTWIGIYFSAGVSGTFGPINL